MKTLLGVAAVVLLSSCCISPLVVEAPPEIREAAFAEAGRYIGMEYEWGGQDFPSSRGIDCSGLIVNVYYTATMGTDYVIPFSDANVRALYNEHTVAVENPGRGDILFMGEADSSEITHAAVYDRTENGEVFFIDSTHKDDPPINGVTRRSYPATDPKLKSWGRMLLEKRN